MEKPYRHVVPVDLAVLVLCSVTRFERFLALEANLYHFDVSIDARLASAFVGSMELSVQHTADPSVLFPSSLEKDQVSFLILHLLHSRSLMLETPVCWPAFPSFEVGGLVEDMLEVTAANV